MCETDSEQETARWPWSLLGLEPTADIRGIRIAYARALKQIDQQNDVSGFQALREARDEAATLAAGLAREKADGGGLALEPEPSPVVLQEADSQDVGAGKAGVAETIFYPLDVLLRSPQARSSLSSWARMLDERPLMSDRQAYAFERCVVLAIDSWLDSESLPSHEVFLVLDNTFGWSSARSNLPEFLPRLRERRLRTIISSLKP
jgi:hypothetical protein